LKNKKGSNSDEDNENLISEIDDLEKKNVEYEILED